jgi:hypothetical protein
MPKLVRSHTLLLPALGALLTLLAGPAQAAMQTLNDQSLGEVSGQDGISLFVSLNAKITKISYNDDGNSASLRNLVVDSGTVNNLTSGPNMCAGGPGTCFFNAGLGLMSANIPTLKVDVITTNISGTPTQQLALTLPDLTTYNEERILGGNDPIDIKLRVKADLYVGESRLGSFEVRDIKDISGQIRIWGH